MTTLTKPAISKPRKQSQKPQIVLYGAGDTGLEAVELIEMTRAFRVAGFLDDFKTGQFAGYSILGTGTKLAQIRTAGIEYLAVTISVDLPKRLELASRALRAAFQLPKLLHPQANVSERAEIEEGVIVFEYASAAPGAVLGRMCVLKPYARVAHYAQIEEGTVLAPYAYVGSHARVGKRSLLGIRSSVQSGSNVGDDCVIYPSTHIRDPVPSCSVAYGSPVVVRERANNHST